MIGGYYLTHKYARSETERALLSAGQFAHLEAEAVVGWLDGRTDQLSTVVRLYSREGPDEFARAYFLSDTFETLAKERGTLCPVCLAPCIKTEGYYSRSLLPSAIVFGSDVLLRRVHRRCKPLADILDIYVDPKWMFDESYSWRVREYWRSSRFANYKQWLRSLPPPQLRFDPRRPATDHPEDMRFAIQDSDCDPSLETYWIRNTPCYRFRDSPEGRSLSEV